MQASIRARDLAREIYLRRLLPTTKSLGITLSIGLVKKIEEKIVPRNASVAQSVRAQHW